jgi:hypothetical protein
MAYQYIEAPKVIEIKNDISVFFAGGISQCEDWQKYSEEKLSGLDELTVVNPRRNNWKVDKDEVEESVKQIGWEFKYIRKVTDIIFWFTDDTLQPISLYELGAALQRNAQYWDSNKPMEDEKGFVKGQRVFLGADSNYKRVLDVKVQGKLIGYRWPIRNNLDDLLEDFSRYYNKIKGV